jgi:hypothetical protein
MKGQKSPMTPIFFFAFKGILVISMCFLIVYYFLYLVKYQIFP